MIRRFLLGLGALLGVLSILYLVWLSSQPERLLSDLSRKTGLRVTTRQSSSHLPYRLTYDDLRIAPPPGRSHGITISVDHAVLSSQGLHSTLIRFWGMTFKSRNPVENLLLTVLDVSHGSVSFLQKPNKVIVDPVVMDDGPLHLQGKGVVMERDSKGPVRFDFNFSVESKGDLKSFLGPGVQKGRFWGDKENAHLMIGERPVF